MTEQTPAETQARWKAAMLGGEAFADEGGVWWIWLGDTESGNDFPVESIYESDTALIDAVSLVMHDRKLSFEYYADGIEVRMETEAGQVSHAWTDNYDFEFRAALTAAVEAAIREWEQNDGN